MSEVTERPVLSPPMGPPDVTDNSGDDFNSRISGWTLHLTVLLTVLIALLWLTPQQSSSPTLLSASTDLATHQIENDNELDPSPSSLSFESSLSEDASSPLEPSQLAQQVRETDEEDLPAALPTATAFPQVGQRPQRPPLLITSRGGARPAFAPSTFTLIRDAVPHTIIPDRPRLEVITYTVQSGDTVIDIAERFGLETDTIMWASGRLEDHPDLLQIGQVLTVLPLDGVYHTVQKGDTLAAIAKKYKVDMEAIAQSEYNGLEGQDELTVGQKIIVPGGKKPYVPLVVHAYVGKVPTGAVKGTGIFDWPVTGRITQNFWTSHKAIDIGAPTGRTVIAADSGYVATVGWSKYGYGNYIVIDHGNGFQTLYAHLSAVLVEVGQSVGKGGRIGSVGSTGRSTGPHLHFEIRYQGAQRNPFGYLP